MREPDSRNLSTLNSDEFVDEGMAVAWESVDGVRGSVDGVRGSVGDSEDVDGVRGSLGDSEVNTEGGDSEVNTDVRDSGVNVEDREDNGPEKNSMSVGVDSDVGVEASSEALGRGHRQPKPSVLLKDFVSYSACCSKDPERSVLTSPTGFSGTSLYPIAHYVTCDNFSA